MRHETVSSHQEEAPEAVGTHGSPRTWLTSLMFPKMEDISATGPGTAPGHWKRTDSRDG